MYGNPTGWPVKSWKSWKCRFFFYHRGDERQSRRSWNKALYESEKSKIRFFYSPSSDYLSVEMKCGNFQWIRETSDNTGRDNIRLSSCRSKNFMYDFLYSYCSNDFYRWKWGVENVITFVSKNGMKKTGIKKIVTISFSKKKIKSLCGNCFCLDKIKKCYVE